MTLASPTARAARAISGATLVPTAHSARILDAVLMGLIVVRVSLPGTPFPVAQIGIAVLVIVGCFRRPTRSFVHAWWVPAAMLGLLAFLVIETWLQGIDPVRRAGNLAILIVMSLFLASGRIDVGSAVKGIGVGLLLNGALFYAGVAPDNYQGRLTGFLEDKNAGALVIALGTFLLFLVIRSRWGRLLLVVAGAAAIAATDSRTTMAASFVALVWLLSSRYLRRTAQLATLGMAFLAFLWADDNLATIGDYGETREGSDEFRSRIDAASSLKAAAAPWHGFGLGEATVSLDSGTWFFHNAYEALIVEGGFVLAAVVLGLFVVAGLGLAPRAVGVDVTSGESRVITAATLVVFCCALRLGEVFLAPIGLVVLGIGIARMLPPLPSGQPASEHR
ncbi:O-antigen ligase family protein [Microbacterium esteraromaticum]|uniref:O-antigen ligase family protein n=1 Tax=Microbacterium esteraromaticum TaxID=57043 RepID=UPI001956CD8F|nr:O-antigen ligase family protein [Microbacterium esteraromaticum]MBM7466694.1 hypothetical protein [Microbacterium esteraromaticum]